MPLSHSDSFPERVEELFHAALDLKPAERSSFLTRTCGDDETLRISVQKLLAAMAEVESDPAWSAGAIANEAAAAANAGGTELDRYRLSSRIGAGGMGVVYKALRADDAFSKLVAVKIVQASDPLMVERFLQERQILARLEHPNIARLLDGGSTPEGLPFLVMEFVDGIPIDEYVQRERPRERELLELFRKICAAVSYAHANLVVHRDLKPGNILVTPEGEPKLLDFGVAKCLDGSGGRTKTGAGAMTPEYASPEQVRGEPITTRSDIYSLSIILYELLAGARIYRNTANALDLAREICTEEPAPLSVRTGKRFNPDLERIVQMALRKEPERRYASVEQFSEDLRRYLEGFPVVARPATRGYRISKFVGRNSTPLVAAALVLISLVGGIAAAAWEARAANRRFNDVRKLANSYLFEFYDGIRDLPGATPVRRLVVKRALEYLDSLARERGGDTALVGELASAYGRVGDVQGAPNWPNLGDKEGALASYQKSLALFERLAAASPSNTDLQSGLAEVYSKVCSLLTHAGDLTAGAENGRRAVALMEKVVAIKPADTKARDALANVYITLGDTIGNSDVPNLGNPKEALELFRKSVAIREKLAAEEPSRRERRLYLAVCFGRLGTVLQALDDKGGSAAAYRRAIETDEQLSREDPVNVLYRREAAVYNRSLSLLLMRTGALDEAQQRGNRSAELFAALARQDPNNAEARDAVADSYWSQGLLRAKMKDTAGAFQLYDSAIRAYKEIAAAHPGAHPNGLRMALQLTADLSIQTGDAAKATENARKEIEIDDQLLKVNSANAGAQRNKAVAFMQIGQAHQLLAARASASTSTRQNEWREARAWYQRSLDLWIELRNKGTLIPGYAGRLDDARQAVERCDAALKALPGRR